MEVFYINVEKFKKCHNKDFLIPYADTKLNIEKRFWEYTIGRYLVKTVAKERYNIKDVEIVLDKHLKPVFKNANLFFNISHSKNIVIACFDKNPCGIDIEYIKKRDLSKLSNYFNQTFGSLEEFYKFWTYKEASYKLQEKVYDSYFSKFQNNYCLTVVSNQKIDIQKIYSFDELLLNN